MVDEKAREVERQIPVYGVPGTEKGKRVAGGNKTPTLKMLKKMNPETPGMAVKKEDAQNAESVGFFQALAKKVNRRWFTPPPLPSPQSPPRSAPLSIDTLPESLARFGSCTCCSPRAAAASS
jgi:hypothetical protein